jgi:hypothetical protein
MQVLMAHNMTHMDSAGELSSCGHMLLRDLRYYAQSLQTCRTGGVR